MPSGKHSRRWGLALLCGLWLALLSPKVIFGVPDQNNGNQQLRSVSNVIAKAPAQVLASNPVDGSMAISPSEINVSVGRKQSFRLVDQHGQAIHDATWMVSDFTVAELDSVDPPRIAAVAPGEVTVTAILGDQTVQAKVKVTSLPRLSLAQPRGSSSGNNSR